MAVVGILGGRFDPPHLGHVALAEAAVERFGIDDLHVTSSPTRRTSPPRRPPRDRLAMARSRSPSSTQRSSWRSTATPSTRSKPPATTTRSS